MKLKITQVFRVERWITIDVPGDTLDEAIDHYEGGETPPTSDPRWEDHWSLENETTEPG